MKIAAHYDEKALLEGLRGGDASAFEQLYRKFSKQIYWKLLKMVKESDQADDILQDLFIKVWERREQIDTSHSFGAFLHRIAQRMVVDHYRKVSIITKSHLFIQENSTELISPTEDHLDNKETEELLNKAINSLSPQRKQAFRLCRIDGKSHKEAAELMNISTNTIKNHLVSATKQIKSYLDESHASYEGLALLIAFMTIK